MPSFPSLLLRSVGHGTFALKDGPVSCTPYLSVPQYYDCCLRDARVTRSSSSCNIRHHEVTWKRLMTHSSSLLGVPVPVLAAFCTTFRGTNHCSHIIPRRSGRRKKNIRFLSVSSEHVFDFSPLCVLIGGPDWLQLGNFRRLPASPVKPQIR